MIVRHDLCRLGNLRLHKVQYHIVVGMILSAWTKYIRDAAWKVRWYVNRQGRLLIRCMVSCIGAS